jgi:hypothetical protein
LKLLQITKGFERAYVSREALVITGQLGPKRATESKSLSRGEIPPIRNNVNIGK